VPVSAAAQTVPSLFGQSAPSLFGQSMPSSGQSTSAFGASPLSFGQPAAVASPAAPAFGQSAAATSQPALSFGQSAAASGQSAPAFGAFGQSSAAVSTGAATSKPYLWCIAAASANLVASVCPVCLLLCLVPMACWHAAEHEPACPTNIKVVTCISRQLCCLQLSAIAVKQLGSCFCL
jgi:hypothetical protein